YLQMEQDGKALELRNKVAGQAKAFPPVNPATSYAAGAIPARVALERRNYAEAASLPDPRQVAVAKMPFGIAHVHFARAIGAARTKNLPVAKTALASLEMIHMQLSKVPPLRSFILQVDSQRKAAAAFIAHAEGRSADAVALLKEAAAAEDLAGPHPISPGAIIPARELLGDLYLEVGQPKAALAEYEAELRNYPYRFNGLFGAARAAEQAGRPGLARQYYRDLLNVAKGGDGKRPELAQARAYVEKK
ncbi:MAG TPA: hypothetical protein VM347_20820, partial [Nonomuraea sp.]|nr:hypothetical protein [Nonomuraea sp.]